AVFVRLALHALTVDADLPRSADLRLVLRGAGDLALPRPLVADLVVAAIEIVAAADVLFADGRVADPRVAAHSLRALPPRPAGGGEIHGDAEPLHAIAPERALLVRGALVAPAFPENAAQGSGVAALHPQAVAVRAAGGTFTLDAGQARLAVEVGLALGLGASAPGLAAVTVRSLALFGLAAAEGERGAEGQGSDEPEWDPTSHRATASRILSMGVRIAEGQSISRTSQTSPGLDRTLVLWAS